mmetsp:Transcript_7694/g.24678  ORF Transcript_7694/g.24678 Transcript_7694/m.24678 type:complete len:593 (-) Transcript_7694:46-1824(-)
MSSSIDHSSPRASEFAIFDIETTIPSTDIIEFGAIVVHSRSFVERCCYSTLVQSNRVTARSTDVNHITNGMLRNAPKLCEVAHSIYDILHNRIWVGYNIISFDMPIVLREIGKVAPDLVPQPAKVIDLYPILRDTFGKRAGNMKLASLSQYFGFGKEEHRALDDARLTLRVLKNCATTLFLEQHGGMGDSAEKISLLPGTPQHNKFSSADKATVSGETVRVLTEAIFRKEALWMAYAGGRKPNSPRRVRPLYWHKSAGIKIIVCHCFESSTDKHFATHKIMHVSSEPFGEAVASSEPSTPSSSTQVTPINSPLSNSQQPSSFELTDQAILDAVTSEPFGDTQDSQQNEIDVGGHDTDENGEDQNASDDGSSGDDDKPTSYDPAAPDGSTSLLVHSVTLDNGFVLQVRHGDLTQEACDVIVNAANGRLAHGGGVAGAISRRGGAVIQRESNDWVDANGEIATGDVAVTSAGNLPCRWIVHGVGPVWHGGNQNEREHLCSVLRKSMDTADSLGARCLAIPAVSSGIFGFPKPLCASLLVRTAVEVATSTTFKSLVAVRFTNFDQESVDLFEQAVKEADVELRASERIEGSTEKL